MPHKSPTPERIQDFDPNDSVHEAINRLNVVLRILADYSDNPSSARNDDADDDADDTGGFEFTVMRELLTGIRDDLRATVAKVEQLGAIAKALDVKAGA